MTNLMLDIETLGTGPHSAMISLATVAFRTTPPFEITDRFYSKCRPNPLYDEVDLETVEWWMKNKTLCPLDMKAPPVERVLHDFSNWVVKYAGLPLWAKSPDFDCVILERHFVRRDIPTPLHFRNWRDVRTLKHVVRHATGADVPPVENLTPHHALADAEAQAQWVFFALQCLRKE